MLVTLLAACGGGGSSVQSTGVLPDAPGDSHAPTATSSPRSTPKPTSAPTATPTPPPARSATNAHIPSTVGRIGLFQVFDYHGGRIPSSQIQQNGRRYDAVWGSVEPGAWSSAHHGMIVSNYFIMGMDQYAATKHTLSWWQKNHPDWILYACTSSGQPTHDIAYMPGISVPDMPLDIHNPAVVDYQIGTMAAYASANGYNSLAIDQVVFWNTYKGGNPAMGQKLRDGEYGCGSWHGNTFERRYASPQDPQWNADVVAYVRQAHTLLRSRGMTLIVNHPAGNTSDPNEQQLLASTDVDLDETGFSDYGRYTQDNGGIFKRELLFMQYAQQHGTGVLITDKFQNETHVSAAGLEYALATYLLGNDGAALLFTGGAHEYGTMQYHPEYDQRIGTPCSGVAGGPHVYARAFSGGLAVVNASAAAQTYSLPSGKSYRDIEGRSVHNPLTLAPEDAYVLVTASGGGC